MLDSTIRTPSRGVQIPPAHPERFVGAIIHPTLWLWDSWVDARNDGIDLYCLALSRTGANNLPILPGERNAYAFHVRRFRSQDGGESWLDMGCFLTPKITGDGHCVRNVWSGSCLDLDNGRTLHALTGLRELGPERPFLQSLFIAEAEANARSLDPPPTALLCPLRDYDEIVAAGYYLGPKDNLGSADGEDEGPILAWRDPFVTRDKAGQLHLLWSAKSSAVEGCVGHALISKEASGQWQASLQAPIILPASEKITQAEVPKLYPSANGEGYYLLISGCDRLCETQPEAEVSKTHNLFHSQSITGPWQPYSTTSVLKLDKNFLYGGSFLDQAISPPAARLIAPYTELADPHLQLTFDMVQIVSF